MSNRTKSDYRRWIEPVLAGAPEEAVALQGFKRRGVVFDRLVGGVKQVLRFDLVVRPPYARDSAQLVLNVDISVPDADDIYARSVASLPDARNPYFLRVSSDSLKKIPGRQWLFADEEQARALAEPIAKLLSSDVVPFLDQRSSVAALAAMCVAEIESEVQASGFLVGDRAVYVAALLSSVGNDAEARRLLEAAYPPESRGRLAYGPVIELYTART